MNNLEVIWGTAIAYQKPILQRNLNSHHREKYKKLNTCQQNSRRYPKCNQNRIHGCT